MIIALSDSFITYAIEVAANTGDTEKINYICNRVIEAVPIFPKSTTAQALQQVDDFMKLEPTYLKYAPFNRLQEALMLHLKEFAA